MRRVLTPNTIPKWPARVSSDVPRKRSHVFTRTLAAAIFGMIAASSLVPTVVNAAGHSCDSGDACVFNNASFNADPPGGWGVTNPWSAFNNRYYNMYNWPSPHTYNNPDVCNNTMAGLAACNINDTISAVKNRDLTYKLRLFNDAGYSGNYQTLGAGIGTTQVTYNDQITSFCWNTGGGGSACVF